MKQIDAVAQSASSPITDAVVLVVPNTTAEPVTSNTTDELVTTSTTAETVAPRTTAVTVKAISDVKRVDRPQSVAIITEKETERPFLKREMTCTFYMFKKNDECSTDRDCVAAHRYYQYPYCVRSKGPQSRKICCVFR